MKNEIIKTAKDLEQGTITESEARTLLLGLFGVSNSVYEMPVEYDKLVKINKLLRELLRENETDLKNIESAKGVWRSSKDGGNYCP